MISLKGLSTFLLFGIAISGSAQKLQVLNSNSTRLEIRDGSDFRKGRWNIDLKTKPDIFKSVIDNKYKWVSFISDIDSLRFKVKAGWKYPFLVILNKKDTAYTEIDGVKTVPYALFDKRYIKSHEGKSFVEISMVYELFNIATALTSIGKKEMV